MSNDVESDEISQYPEGSWGYEVDHKLYEINERLDDSPGLIERYRLLKAKRKLENARQRMNDDLDEFVRDLYEL